MHNEIAGFINQKIPGANATVNTPEAGDLSITVEAGKIVEVCRALRDDAHWKFHVLEVVSGVDYKEFIEVNYVIANFEPGKGHEIILKVKLPISDRKAEVEVDSVCEIWPAANFQERECYDMLGVRFRNHPDHRRILCPEDWIGFPLRKDYVAEKMYNGMEIYPEHKMNNADREFAEKQKAMEKAAAGPAAPADA